MAKEQGRKDIICYKCGSDRVRAYIDFSIEKPPRPKVNFECADCLDELVGVPNPIMGIGITKDSLKFIFGAEEMAEKLKKKLSTN